MKNIISFIFAAVLGAILAGCSGGGGGESLSVEKRYIPTWYNSNSMNTVEETLTLFRQLINGAGGANISLRLSNNPIPTAPTARAISPSAAFYNIVIEGAEAGDTYAFTITSFMDTLITSNFRVFEQNGTNYLATECAGDFLIMDCNDIDTNGVFSIDGTTSARLSVRIFTLPDNVFTVEDVFYFNRGLIRDSYNFGGLHINAENQHVEYRLTPFSDVLIDSGFRRFDKASLIYGKAQMNIGDFYGQWTTGRIKSSHYQEETLNGVAFGWQKNNFAVKAEKPFGNGDEKWLRLFYKQELK